ncbi:MAG: Ig-like domain-containing protein [Gemmatimonadaceae bacterium]
MTNAKSISSRKPVRRSLRLVLLTLSGTAIMSCSGDSGGPVGPLPVASISVTGATTTFEIGQQVQFTAVPRSSNGNPVSGAAITWSVSPQSVASVSATGLVTAKAAGSATVTASIGTVAGSAGLTINDSGIPFATTVSMPGNSFSPFAVTIRRTGSVSFDFPSVQHDVTFKAQAGVPANIPVTRLAVVSRTFNVVGVFPYDCLIHPGMSGQVTVAQ